MTRADANMGARADHPNVPNEPNPFRSGTRAWRRWNDGSLAAVASVIDGEE